MMTEEHKQALIARCNYLIGGAPEIDVQLAEFALAALTQPARPALKLPDGWRLVPDEPTEEMMRAMYQAQDMWPSAHCDNMRETQMSFARPRYIAALATSPKAPSVPHTAPIEPICATGGAEWVKVSDVEIEQELISLQSGNGQLRGESFYQEALKELLAMRSMPIPDKFLNAQQNASGMFEISEDCMCQLLNMLCSKP